MSHNRTFRAILRGPGEVNAGYSFELGPGSCTVCIAYSFVVLYKRSSLRAVVPVLPLARGFLSAR